MCRLCWKNWAKAGPQQQNWVLHFCGCWCESMAAFLFLKSFYYLKKDEKRNRFFSILRFTLQNVCNFLKPGAWTSIEVSHGWQGPKHCWLQECTLAGSWIGNKTLRTWTGFADVMWTTHRAPDPVPDAHPTLLLLFDRITFILQDSYQYSFFKISHYHHIGHGFRRKAEVYLKRGDFLSLFL